MLERQHHGNRVIRLWSGSARRRRRVGVILSGVALVLFMTAAVSVWLAVTTGEWWPLVVAGAEGLVALVSGRCAYRYLRRAWEGASVHYHPALFRPVWDAVPERADNQA